MKNFSKRLIAFGSSLLFLLSGCGNNENQEVNNEPKNEEKSEEKSNFKAITSLNLSYAQNELEVGMQLLPQLSVSPVDTTETYLFFSGNENIASVDDDGTIKALTPGEVDIRVEASISDVVSSFHLTVVESQMTTKYSRMEGLDLLYEIFDDYRYQNSTIVNDGYATEYFLDERGYYCDYIDLINETYQIDDFGYLMTEKAIYDFYLDKDENVVLNSFKKFAQKDYLNDYMINNPMDLYFYGRYNPENQEAYWMEDKQFEIPEVEQGENPYLNNHGVFKSTSEDMILLVGTLGGVDFDQDEDGNYDTSAYTVCRVAIKSDYTLHFELGNDVMLRTIFEIKDVCRTFFKPLEKFFEDPHELEAPTKFPLSFEQRLEQYFNDRNALPFPTGLAIFTIKFSGGEFNGGYATWYDDLCGDVTEQYLDICEDAGYTEMQNDGNTICDRLLYKPSTIEGKELRIALSYSEPSSDSPYGTFVATCFITKAAENH